MKALKWLWGKVDRFNLWLMSGLADLNATPWVFYLLCFTIMKTLTYQKPEGILGWTTFMINTLYQGAALPLLAFISKREGAVIMTYLKETFDKVLLLLDLVATVLVAIQEDDKRDRENAERDRQMMAELHEMHRQMKCINCDGQPQIDEAR